MARSDRPSLASVLAQADHFIDPATGAVVPPIQPATTFARGADYELPDRYIYGRYDSPTVAQLESVLAELDGASEALVFGSGMAAFAALVEIVSSGQRIVAPRIMYHGGLSWLRRVAEKRGITLDLFDPAEPDALERAVTADRTALLWIESPVNPTWDVIDIAGAAEIGHAHGALVAVDATVAPPVTMRALDLGADIVFHSATKYLNGHSDVSGGVLAARGTSPAWEEIKAVRGLLGGVMGAFEAWLMLRGLRTLDVRFERISQNALKLARHFDGHAKIDRVLYPGLESHPGHDVAKRQMSAGFGGMLSLLVKGGAEDAKRVASGVRLIVPATSLGGVESLIEHRATVEGPESEVPKNLLRLSVGIESVDDLIADLEQALDRM